jgi:predicted alpha/beta superfamily hydrolase
LVFPRSARRPLFALLASASALLALAGCTPAADARAAEQARPASPVAVFQTDAAEFAVPGSKVHTLPASAQGRVYQVYVKTPFGYDAPENAGRKWPVIYLNDGPYAFQVASGVTDLPFRFGRLEQAILVGISYAQGDNGMVSRRRDMTPWKDASLASASGGAADYLVFIKGQVLPFVESRYRADPRRRTLAGQSYGGLFGAWVAVTEPELFDSYVLTSPSLWYGHREMFKAEAAYAAGHKDLKARIYLATGALERPRPGGDAEDMVADQQAFARALRGRGYPGLKVRDEIMDDTFHETTFPVAFTRGLTWLFPKA